MVQIKRARRTLSVTAVVITAFLPSCGIWPQFDMGSKGYTSDYDRRNNRGVVFIRKDKLESLGGPKSEQTAEFIEDLVRREGYCGGEKFRYSAHINPRGEFWEFIGSCSK